MRLKAYIRVLTAVEFDYGVPELDLQPNPDQPPGTDPERQTFVGVNEAQVLKARRGAARDMERRAKDLVGQAGVEVVEYVVESVEEVGP